MALRAAWLKRRSQFGKYPVIPPLFIGTRQGASGLKSLTISVTSSRVTNPYDRIVVMSIWVFR